MAARLVQLIFGWQLCWRSKGWASFRQKRFVQVISTRSYQLPIDYLTGRIHGLDSYACGSPWFDLFGSWLVVLLLAFQSLTCWATFTQLSQCMDCHYSFVDAYSVAIVCYLVHFKLVSQFLFVSSLLMMDAWYVALFCSAKHHHWKHLQKATPLMTLVAIDARHGWKLASAIR